MHFHLVAIWLNATVADEVHQELHVEVAHSNEADEPVHKIVNAQDRIVIMYAFITLLCPRGLPWLST